MAPVSGFGVDSQLLRSLHFMLLEHDLAKDPGRFRTGAVYVRDESTGEVVYQGPDAGLVPSLVDHLAEELNTDRGEPMVDAAMAHLNLVMIRPFRDGNGRMSSSAVVVGWCRRRCQGWDRDRRAGRRRLPGRRRP